MEMQRNSSFWRCYLSLIFIILLYSILLLQPNTAILANQDTIKAQNIIKKFSNNKYHIDSILHVISDKSKYIIDISDLIKFAYKQIKKNKLDSASYEQLFQLSKVSSKYNNEQLGNQILNELYSIYFENKEYKNLAILTRYLGDLENKKNNFDIALKYYYESIKNFEILNNLNEPSKLNIKLGHTFTATGLLLSNLKKYEEAGKYYFSAFEIYQNLKDSLSLAGICNNIGIVNHKTQNFNVALKYFKIGQNISEKIKNETLLSLILINIGAVLIDLKDYDAANEVLLKSLSLNKKLNRTKGVLTSQMNLAHIKFHKRKFADAVISYQNTLKLANDLEETFYISEIYNKLYLSYKEINDYKNAYDYAIKYFEIQDSIFNLESNNKIIEMNVKYNSEKQAKELNELKLKDEQSRVKLQKVIIWIIMGTIAITIVIAFIYFRLYKNNKKYASELKLANIEVEKADKLKTEIIANMNHEIRTPLNFIKQSAALLKMDIDDSNSEVIETLDFLNQGVNRLSNTLQLFTDLSQLKINAYQPIMKEIDLTILVNERFAHFHKIVKSIKPSIEFEFSNDSSNILILGDESSIEKAIDYILDNAIKFTHHGKIIINLTKNNDKAFLMIKDTGIGISKEYLPLLFEPFTQEYTGRAREYEGIGLSLALAKEYSILNDFEIEVESEKNVGSKFILIFNVYLHL